jgi:hypothetical protein
MQANAVRRRHSPLRQVRGTDNGARALEFLVNLVETEDWTTFDDNGGTTMTEACAAPRRLRYAGTCGSCGAALAAGTTGFYDASTKIVTCTSCGPQQSGDPSTAEPPVGIAVDAIPAPPIGPQVVGQAGRSARDEYTRRSSAREQRIRASHPRIGGLILAVTDEPQSTRVWATGAVGEERLAERLDKLIASGCWVFHDRQMPGSSANIDHLVVASSGVWAIDAKKYKGRPRLQVDGGLFRARTERLFVGTRDQSKLAAGVHKQLAAVSRILEASLDFSPPLGGMLCFVDGDWPLVGGSFRFDGLDVLWPKKAQDRILAPGPVSAKHASRIAAALDSGLKSK